MYIELDQDTGIERLNSKIEVITVTPFDNLDLVVEKHTQHVTSSWVRRNTGQALDFYAQTGKDIPTNDRYTLSYTFQPGNMTLDNKQVLGDRIHPYRDEQRFESFLYAALANTLRKIQDAVKEKSAKARVKLHTSKSYVSVEQAVESLYDPKVIEEIRLQLEGQALLAQNQSEREKFLKQSKLPEKELVPFVSVATRLG